MNAKYYDLNVWSSDPKELWLTAYEWELDETGDYVQQNSSKYHSIQFNLLEDIKEIEFLLNDLYVNHYPLTDYDEWRDLDELLNEKTPARVRQFLEDLPAYDVPKIAL
jgi:hypothetical protein